MAVIFQNLLTRVLGASVQIGGRVAGMAIGSHACILYKRGRPCNHAQVKNGSSLYADTAGNRFSKSCTVFDVVIKIRHPANARMPTRGTARILAIGTIIMSAYDHLISAWQCLNASSTQ